MKDTLILIAVLLVMPPGWIFMAIVLDGITDIVKAWKK